MMHDVARVHSPCPSIALQKQQLLGAAPNMNHLKQEDWGWIIDQKTPEVEVSDKNVLFHPLFAFGTAAVRGTKVLSSSTTAYWEVRTCTNIFGTSIMFGVGTAATKIKRMSSFCDLLGRDDNSYGLNHYGKGFHGGISIDVCKPIKSQAGSVIGILFDGPNRTISYFIDGEFIGTPFTDIDTSVNFYPMIASTAQQSQFAVQNQSSVEHPSSLFQVSLRKVHSTFRDKWATLPIPTTMKTLLSSMEKNRKHRSVIVKKTKPKRGSHSSTHIPLWFHAYRYSMGVEDDQ